VIQSPIIMPEGRDGCRAHQLSSLLNFQRPNFHLRVPLPSLTIAADRGYTEGLYCTALIDSGGADSDGP